MVNFDNFRNNFVKKITVMSDNNDRTFVVHQKCFQPGCRIHVKVVGRFVEQKNVRFRQKKASEGHAGFLTAGKQRNLFGKILLCKSETL